MELVATLIAAPESGTLTAGLAEAAATALASAGAETASPDWLAPGEACDLAFRGLDRDRAASVLRAALGTAPLDLGILPAVGRRKRLLVADMESTIIAEEMLDEIAARLGLAEEIAPITARAMAGELDFTQALEARVRLLAGQPVALLDEMTRIVTLNPGAQTLVRTMRAQGAMTALVSGGFTHFTSGVREACGFDRDQANRLSVEAGRLTGRLDPPILDRAAKKTALEALAAEGNLPLTAACAVGDGANDLDLLQAAGLGVGYRPKPILRGAADVALDHGDLTALLYLQGYRKAEFVT